jgi:Ni/Co efflux regulator RcnB
MKTRTLMTAVTVMAITFSGLAFAKDKDDEGDHDHGNGHGQKFKHDKREQRGEDRSENRDDDHGERRGAGPDHRFYRGDRLPIEYRDRGYRVEDWHGHQLSAPPRGYHWVQTGGDYVLVADSNNIIFQILLGR